MRPPRVVWITFAPLERHSSGLTSKWASIRYRLLIPAAELQSQGWDSRVSYFGTTTNQRTIAERFTNADVAVLGKFLPAPDEFSSASERLLGLLQALHHGGVKILADFCDDHFVRGEHGQIHVSIMNGAHAVTASTAALAGVLREHGAQTIHIITDPVEGPRRDVWVRDTKHEPVNAGKPLRLLWYGHPVNLGTLSYGLPQLERLLDQCPIALTIVSSGAQTQRLAQDLDAVWKPRGGRCRFTPWSPQTTFAELTRCDAVVIPSNPHDPLKAIKSPNRFTEALWAGRFVLAHPLPSYEELTCFGWVGANLDEGLRWYFEHADDAASRVRHGQSMIETRFSRGAVANAWKAAILSTMGPG